MALNPIQNAIELIVNNAIDVCANAQNDAWPVPSPCLSVCKMDAAGVYCQGCFRTVDEIRAWGKSEPAFKRAIWQKISQRVAERAQ
jgi:predicted Fe-S protein YdhL (DUF1289 family)